MGTFTRDWDEATPTNANYAHELDDYQRYRVIDIAERLKAMFYGFTLGENSFEASVKHLNLKDQSSVAAPSSGYSRIYCKNVGGKSEFFVQNDDGDEVQLTTDGIIKLSSASLLGILANNTYLTAVDNAGSGTVNLIKATTADKVQLPDASQLASSAAPTADAQIANKKYVDDTPHTAGIVQTVKLETGAWNSGSATIPIDDTIPQKTEGMEFMTLNVTPTNASNLLVIDVLANLYSPQATTIAGALFKDEGSDALAAAAHTKGEYSYIQIRIHHEMTAGTTSQITFKFRAGGGTTIAFNGNHTGRIFGGNMNSSIRIQEIKV